LERNGEEGLGKKEGASGINRGKWEGELWGVNFSS